MKVKNQPISLQVLSQLSLYLKNRQNWHSTQLQQVRVQSAQSEISNLCANMQRTCIARSNSYTRGFGYSQIISQHISLHKEVYVGQFHNSSMNHKAYFCKCEKLCTISTQSTNKLEKKEQRQEHSGNYVVRTKPTSMGKRRDKFYYSEGSSWTRAKGMVIWE